MLKNIPVYSTRGQSRRYGHLHVAVTHLEQILLVIGVYWPENLSPLASTLKYLEMLASKRMKGYGCWDCTVKVFVQPLHLTAWNVGTRCLIFWNRSLSFGKFAFHSKKQCSWVSFSLSKQTLHVLCEQDKETYHYNLERKLEPDSYMGWEIIRNPISDCHITKTVLMGSWLIILITDNRFLMRFWSSCNNNWNFLEIVQVKW